MRTFAYIFALLLLSSPVLRAQTPGDNRPKAEAGKAQKAVADTLGGGAARRAWHLSVGTDLAGAVLAAATAYGSLEGNLRLNLRETYFPTVEAGLGLSDHRNEETQIHYRTRSPYFRLGCDYNFLNDKTSGNRVFGGLRYGVSPFSYDVDGPALHDAVYHEDVPFSYKGLSAWSHWAEIVGGIEARVWGILHLGWSVRYKLRISESTTTVGHAWYVPGYGKSGGSVMTGTFNVSIDI
ncbi:MAG: hypothetical protein IJ659_06880 [Alloprevotella sp.]|nr:hypothetical protein [Alloprevotella sp.]